MAEGRQRGRGWSPDYELTQVIGLSALRSESAPAHQEATLTARDGSWSEGRAGEVQVSGGTKLSNCCFGQTACGSFARGGVFTCSNANCSILLINLMSQWIGISVDPQT